MENWYVLFVHHGKEEEVIHQINEIDTLGKVYPFVPTLKKTQSFFGKRTVIDCPLFPDYVFLETNLEQQELYEYIGLFFRISSDIIKMLKYGNTGEAKLSKTDCILLKQLLNEKKCLEMSTGLIEGDKVIITSGPLVGKESLIKKIDRHKRIAMVELDFLGQKQQMRVGLEIISKS